MRYTYDGETDILSIAISDDEAEFGEQTGNLILHRGRDGALLEVEILDASNTVLGLLRAILARTRGEATR